MKKLAIILEADYKQELFICEVEIDKENNLSKEDNNELLFKVNKVLLEGETVEFDFEKNFLDEFTGKKEHDGLVFYSMLEIEKFKGLVYLLEEDRVEGLMESYVQAKNSEYLSQVMVVENGDKLIKAIQTNEKQLISSRLVLVENKDSSKYQWLNVYIYPDGIIREVIES